MSAFIQKVLPEAMTNYRLHLALIKSYMLDTRSAAKYPIDSELRTIKDMNYVTKPGLYRLTKDTRNYCNPEDTSNQYWYEPSKDTTGMPSRSVAYAYITPLTSEYTKQYALIGAEGHVDINTRLGHYFNGEWTWSKWRPYSDRNPSYELLQDTNGKANTNYISFGNHELQLPDAKECDLGTVIRLDQWKGNGRVYSVEGSTNYNGEFVYNEKDTVDTIPVLLTFGADLILQDGQDTIAIPRLGVFDWANAEYAIDTILVDDVFHWTIRKNDEEIYRSEQCLDEASDPQSARYKVVDNGVVTDEYANITLTPSESSQSDDTIDTCNTYEFEVFNDHEPYNSAFNYWVLFVYNESKDSTAKLAKIYNQSINDLKQDIEDVHNHVTLVSGWLSNYTNDQIESHNNDPTAHPYILDLIAMISSVSGAGGTIASHLVDTNAHANVFAPIYNWASATSKTVDQVSNNVGIVSKQVTNYVNLTSSFITDYVLSFSNNVYNEINNVSNQYVALSATIGDFSNIIYTDMTSCCENMTSLIYSVSHDLSAYTDVTSQDITDFVMKLSGVVSSIYYGDDTDLTSLIYTVSKNLSDYVDATSSIVTTYVDTISQSIATHIDTVSTDLSTYVDTVSSDLSSYVDLTSQNISEYLNTLSFAVDVGISTVEVYSGLTATSSEDGHTVYISGVPATLSDYGMVTITSEVVSLVEGVDSSTYTVPNTNAVYSAIKDVSANIGTVSQDLSTYIDNTSWYITDYILKFSSSVYSYIDITESGILEASGHSGIYVDTTENNRSIHISGLPASSDAYGMVYAITSIGPIADDVTEKDHMVPTVEAVLNLGGVISANIMTVSRDLSWYIDATSYNISNYVDVTSKLITDYINTLSWGVVSEFIYIVSEVYTTNYITSHISNISEISQFNISNISEISQFNVSEISNFYSEISQFLIESHISNVSVFSSTIHTSHISNISNISEISQFYSEISQFNISYVSHIHISEVSVFSSTINAPVTNITSHVSQISEISQFYTEISQFNISYVSYIHISEVSLFSSTIHTSHISNISNISEISQFYTEVSEFNISYVSHIHVSDVSVFSSTIHTSHISNISNISEISNFYSEISQFNISYVSHIHISEVSVFSSTINAPVSNITSHISNISEISQFYTEVSEFNISYVSHIHISEVSLFSSTIHTSHISNISNISEISNFYSEISQFNISYVSHIHLSEVSVFSSTIHTSHISNISHVSEVSNFYSEISNFYYADTYVSNFYISNISNFYAAISSVAPIYTSKSGTEYSIALAIDSTYYGGAQVSTVVLNNSTYLMANAQQPDAGNKIGTVKTQDNLIWVEGASSNYTVPTVNAVSQAIVKAIYITSVNYYITNISNFYLGTSGDYVPWSAIVTQENRPDVWAYTLGADFYIYGSNELLFNYNNPTDGAGWAIEAGYTRDNFGAVITWDKVSRIDTTINEPHPVVPGADKTINLVGNPGDKFVVPTVNAVYDALQELSAKIPVITSRNIYIVSEVSVENHYHSYVTNVTQVSNFYNTYTSEYHYHVSNYYHNSHIYNITSNFYANVSAYSGLISVVRENQKLIEISGLPAAETSYGMVYTRGYIEDLIGGDTSNYTVPTVNAVLNRLSLYVPWSGINDSAHLTPTAGIFGANLYIREFVVNDDIRRELLTYNQPASGTGKGNNYLQNFGVVLTWSKIESIGETVDTVVPVWPGASSNIHLNGNPGDQYIVPTVNAVYNALQKISQTPVPLDDYVPYAKLDETNYNGVQIAVNNRVVSAMGSPVQNTVGGTGTGGSYGVVKTINDIPDTALVTAAAYTNADGDSVTIAAAGDKCIVPTVNAIIRKFGAYTSGIYGVVPIYTSRNGNNYQIKLAIDSTYRHGVRTSTVVVNGSTYLMADAQNPNADPQNQKEGTVRTSSKLIRVTDSTSNFTVPTVNAVIDAIGTSRINVHGIEPIYVSHNELNEYVGLYYNTVLYGGVGLLTSTINGSNHLIARAQQPDATKNTLGTVYTQSTLDRVVDYTSNYTVPTVNAIETGFSRYIKWEEVYDEDDANIVTFGGKFYKYHNADATVNALVTYNQFTDGVKPNVAAIGQARFGVVIAVNDVYEIKTVVNSNVYLYNNGAAININGNPGDSFVVPTVNAVYRAITSVIYAPSNIHISNISNFYWTDVSGYIPWSAVVTPENRPDVWAFTLGADFYIYGDNELLFNYNNPADGAGWGLTGGYTRDNFGAVITWDRISRINTTINEPHPVVPGGDKTINLVGNPGDKFVVPTVNAVYDALMELSAKIPVITSRNIYIVSEVNVENHNYDYHTEVINNVTSYVTNVSEYIVTQTMNLNVYSGLSSVKVNDTTYNISGLPASFTSYGMVFVTNEVAELTGAAAQYTVPNVNAIYNALQRVSGDYVPWSKIANANDEEYHDVIIDFGARLYIDRFEYGNIPGQVVEWRKLFAYNELAIGLTTIPSPVLSGVNEWAGAVVTIQSVQRINGAVNESLPLDTVNPKEYIYYMGNPGDDFVVPTVNAVADAISEVSRYAYQYRVQNHTYHVAGFTEVYTHLDSVVGHTTINGVNYNNAEHIVPSINVLADVSAALLEHEQHYPHGGGGGTTYTPEIPIYIDDYDTIGLSRHEIVYRGVGLGIMNNALMVSGVPAQFGGNPTTWSFGVVKTYDGVSYIATTQRTDGVYYDYQYTVPTLNALNWVSYLVYSHSVDGTKHPSFNTGEYSGAKLVKNNDTYSAAGVVASSTTYTDSRQKVVGVVEVHQAVTSFTAAESRADIANKPRYLYAVAGINALAEVSKALSAHDANTTKHQNTTYTFNTTTYTGVKLVYDTTNRYVSAAGVPASSAPSPATAAASGTFSLGVTEVHTDIVSYGGTESRNDVAGYLRKDYAVPSVNALAAVSYALYYHKTYDTHGGGGGGLQSIAGVSPIWISNTNSVCVSEATTNSKGVVKVTNSLSDNPYDFIVPTARAVYLALLNGGGGGGGGARYPNYGSAGGIGSSSGNTVASGTAGASGAWILISIVTTGTAQGCVGIGINGTYIPLAGLKDGAITQLIPVPPGANWSVYNGGGSGTIVQVRVL